MRFRFFAALALAAALATAAGAQAQTAARQTSTSQTGETGSNIDSGRTSRVELDHERIARAALERHIRPGFAALVTAFARLETAASACRKAPETFRYGTVRPAFREAIGAWSHVAHLNFGPLAAENRYDRIFFWIDRKGIARRQVERALREAPDGYRDPAELAGRSIGVQGLPAFEQLMISQRKAGESAEFECAYAIAIAGNLKTIASRVAEAWADGGDWSRRWLEPGSAGSPYLSPKETTYALVNLFLEHSERVRDVELMRPLGLAVRGKTLPGPFADSDLTMPFIAGRLRGLRALMSETGLEAAVTAAADRNALPQAHQAIMQVAFELRLLDELSHKLAKTPKFFTSKRRSEAIALGYPLKSARQMAMQAFGLVTDMPLGFNATDGD